MRCVGFGGRVVEVKAEIQRTVQVLRCPRKLGSKVIGSVGYNPKEYPSYKQVK